MLTVQVILNLFNFSIHIKSNAMVIFNGVNFLFAIFTNPLAKRYTLFSLNILSNFLSCIVKECCLDLTLIFVNKIDIQYISTAFIWTPLFQRIFFSNSSLYFPVSWVRVEYFYRCVICIRITLSRLICRGEFLISLIEPVLVIWSLTFLSGSCSSSSHRGRHDSCLYWWM